MANAIVLSGGGAAGDFEVGAVRLLLQRGIVPDILVGTSVGAINATKIAEGEGTADQGFAGLLAIWLSLRGNDDMWRAATWLSTIDIEFQRALINRVMPNLSGPSSGNNDVEKEINGFLWLIDDGQKILRVLDAVRKARSFATLDPIGALFSSALDVAKLRASGRKLRLGTVSLETGKLRFVTETGTIVERDQVTTVGTMNGPPPARVAEIRDEMRTIDAEIATLSADLIGASTTERPGIVAQIAAKREMRAALRAELATVLASIPRVPLTVPLPAGIMASSSIAMLFPPVQLGDEFYVDGGHRDQLSADAAVRLGATAIFSVLASPSVMDAPTPDHPDPEHESYAAKTLIEIGVRAGIAVHLNEMVATDILRPAGFTGTFTLITPTISLHDVLTIDPGLIRQSIGYGFMRAADVLDQVSPAVAATADGITLLRAQMWRKESELFGRPVPTDPAADSSTPVPERLNEVLADATRLRGLVAARGQAGGALPPEAARWGTTWEDHPWFANSEGPLTAISLFPDAIEILGRARDGRTMAVSWTPSTSSHAARAMAHGVGQANGWVEAVVTDGEVHAFAIGADGGIHRSIRPVAGRTWSQWWPVGVTGVGNARTHFAAPVHAICRVPGVIDLFWANTLGLILTTNWSATTGWTQPREISGGKTGGGGHVTVVSRNPAQLDAFTIGVGGGVFTAGKTAGSPWTTWTRIGTELGKPGAYVSGVSRNVNMLDIFFADVNGNIMSAAHDPSSPSWKGWWWIQGGVTAPGSYVTAVCANTDKLALFVVGTDRAVYTAFWSPAAGWLGWNGVPGTTAMPGLPVWPVSRRPEQIDIVYTTVNNTIATAGCNASGSPFAGPFHIADHWHLDDLS